MTVKRMDNVGIVVEDLDAAIQFFTELGLELEGRAPIEGDWADGVTGLRDMRVEIAMMRLALRIVIAGCSNELSFRIILLLSRLKNEIGRN